MTASEDLLDGCLLLSWFWSVDPPPPGSHGERLRDLQRQYDVIPNDHRVDAARQWLWHVYVNTDPSTARRLSAEEMARQSRKFTGQLLQHPVVFGAADHNWTPEVTALALRAGLSFEEMREALADPDGVARVEALAALRSSRSSDLALVSAW